MDAEEHKKLRKRYGIKSYPTIKIFGANKTEPELYRGDRTAEAIVNTGLQAKAEADENSYV